MPLDRFVRAASPRVMRGPRGAWILGDGREACLVEGDSGALALAVLQLADRPATVPELVARVLERAEAAEDRRGVVEQAIETLRQLGALVPAGDPAPPLREGDISGARVVVAVTGAIGALNAPALIEQLLRASHHVRVIMTLSARRFVSARTFEAITQQPVTVGLWRRTSPRAPAPHIELARWADLVVVYPATATTIARLAAGDCSELVSAVVTATAAPVLVAPSMNVAMIDAPAVASNLDLLCSRGVFVAEPSRAVEVADAPQERTPRRGGAASVASVVRFVPLLLAQAAAEGPRLASRAEWDAEHARLAARGSEQSGDDDLVELLELHAPRPCRVLEVGTGSGQIAREAARRGHTVVATDHSREAIDRAHALDTEGAVTWAVDDVTDPSVRGVFDVCLDRGCFGCIPSGRRGRYVDAMAGLLRPGGVLLVKVLRAPPPALRAHAFTREEIESAMAAAFDVRGLAESRLSFGDAGDRPAWLVELRRR